jgi:beta-glucanase (GH16 family)
MLGVCVFLAVGLVSFNSLMLSSADAKTVVTPRSIERAPKGSSESLDALTASKARTKPGAPTDVIATSENGEAAVSWSPPVSPDADVVTLYTAVARPGGKTCRYLVSSSAIDTCTVSGLANGTPYNFVVTATNSIGTGPASHPSNGVTPRPATPDTVIFDDEFAGTSLTNAWTEAEGSNPSNGELECYSPTNLKVYGGVLQETASRGTSCGADCPPMSSVLCSYISGAVQWTSLSFTYGTVSVRAKLSGGVGTWPAVWLLGSDCQQPSWLTARCYWPTSGANEIDIAEILGSNQKRVNEQIHVVNTSNVIEAPSCHPLESDVSKNWHTYTLVWAPESLTWLIDGHQTCQMTTLVPDTPMFLIIDTAVGGIGAGKVKDSTLPMSTEIDYVRVTQPSS